MMPVILIEPNELISNPTFINNWLGVFKAKFNPKTINNDRIIILIKTNTFWTLADSFTPFKFNSINMRNNDNTTIEIRRELYSILNTNKK